MRSNLHVRSHLKSLAALSAAVLLCGQAHGQALPTAVVPEAARGLNLGLVNGTFHYDVNVAEIFQSGYIANQGLTYQTNLSGDLAYSSESTVHPFAVIYSGGIQFVNQGSYGNTVFQSLALSQGYNTRTWTFNLADVASYLPQSPTVGLSGIPGAGDLGLSPVTGITTPSQDILTYNSNRVSNTITGSVARRLTARTSISGDASYNLLHFFNNASYDTHSESADLAVNHVLDARTTIGAGVNYSIFGYGGNSGFTTTQNTLTDNASFQTKGAFGRVQHQFTRSLSANVSAGPQWISSSKSLGIPSRLTTQASVGVSYARRFGTFGVYGSRGANGGSGVLPGAISNSIGGSFSRAFGRSWSGSLNSGYSRTEGLASGTNSAPNLAPLGISNYGTFDSVFGGAQVNHRLSHLFSAYASYTAFSQQSSNYNTNSLVTPGAIGTLNNLVQSFSIGVSFSPRPFTLGQF